MANSQQVKKIQCFTICKGNKLTIYAMEGDVKTIVCCANKAFISQSAIVRDSRPKDRPLAYVNYGKMVSSPMGNNITATVRLPKDIASKEEFLHQMVMLYEQAFEGLNKNGNHRNQGTYE